MHPIKGYFIVVFSMLLALSLQAKDPVAKIGQMPPFEINASDTGSLNYLVLSTNAYELASQKNQIVEDTILPPCDVLFFKSGKLEYCKIIETTPSTITYKMCDYQDGPNIVVNKSDIHKIRYANGKEEIVVAEKQPTVNAYVKARKDPLAKLALIFGISSAGIALLFGAVIPALALAGIVLGIISVLKIQRRKGELRGTGAAVIGIVLCALALLLLAL